VVQIDELVEAVAISMEAAPVDDCPAADLDDDRQVSVDEVIRAVRAALVGCSP
jgi:hypothetical protein